MKVAILTLLVIGMLLVAGCGVRTGTISKKTASLDTQKAQSSINSMF